MPVAVSGWKCKVLCFGRQAQNILPSEQSFGQCCFSEAAGCAEKENAPLLHKSFKLLSDKRFYNDIPGQDLTPPCHILSTTTHYYYTHYAKNVNHSKVLDD